MVLCRALVLVLAVVLAAWPAGCTVAHLMALADPGDVPRQAELVSVAPLNNDQVQFTFRFKSGRDLPAGNVADTARLCRVLAARVNDTRGMALAVVEQQIRNEGNVFVVSVAAGPVQPTTYEAVCQVHVAVGYYRVKMASSAYRDRDLWRAEPASFQFAAYAEGDREPILGRW